MSTLTNEELLTAFWRAFNAHDLDAIMSLLDDEVVLHSPATPEPLVGKARVAAAWYLTFTFIVPDLRKEVTWISIGERSAACETLERGTLQIPPSLRSQGADSPGGGRAYELQMAVHFEISGAGLISRVKTFWDTGALARQTGLALDELMDVHRKSIGAAMPDHACAGALAAN